MIPAATARQLARISLPELNAAAANLSRTDSKYVLTPSEADRVLAELTPQCRLLELNGLTSFRYDSIYFDTPGLDSYLMAAHSRPHRFKVRTRHYVESSQSWLEVKTRRGRQTVKERVPIVAPDQDAPRSNGEFIVSALARGRVTDISPATLVPVLRSHYRRTTLLGPDGTSRITVDTELMWGDDDVRFTAPGVVVIETKSARGGGDVNRMLWRLGHRPMRMSKYAVGMAAFHKELPANRWYRTISTHFLTR